MATDQHQLTTGSTFNRSISRRQFLQTVAGAAGLAVVWSSGVSAASPGLDTAGHLVANQERRSRPTDIDSYLAVNADGTITLMTGKVEYGQGIETGFAQLAAEELNVPFASVNVVMGITDKTPYDIGTFGSLSTRSTGPIIRQAAAEMHQWLVQLGAKHLGVSEDNVVAQNGAIMVRDNPSELVTYAELAAGNKAQKELSDDTPLKDPSTYTVVGQRIPRVDVPAKVTGQMKYGYDAQVPGMAHGKIVRPPATGTTLKSIDFSAAEAMPGVVGTFRDGDFAGVVASRREPVEAAVSAVKAVCTENTTGYTSENIFDVIQQTADKGQVLDEKPGDPDTALKGVAKPLSSAFNAPYVAHSPIEPKASLVRIQPDRVDVWTSTQAPFSDQEAVAKTLGVPLEQVVVTPLMSGGAFGSKTPSVTEIEAARLAKAVNRPVKVQWSREEEFQWGRPRPAAHIEIESGLDDQGNVAGWKYTFYTATRYLGADDPTRCGADAGADALEIYNLPNAKSTWYQGYAPFDPNFWRGNGASFHALSREVAMDELAEMAGMDPVSFRTKLLDKNPRMQAVMEAAVKEAGWTPGVGSTGQGIGLALGFGDGTYVAEIAHVEVDKTSGEILVKHVDVAVDCGLVVNPESVLHQVEGAVALSLSPTLQEAITFENGKVTNATFAQSNPLTIDKAPTVDLVFVEDKTQPMQGIGEPAVYEVPPAVSNAVYDAIGVRLREMPFTPDKVLAALQSK
jgi:isoquinoline 1-oxidoreductase